MTVFIDPCYQYCHSCSHVIIYCRLKCNPDHCGELVFRESVKTHCHYCESTQDELLSFNCQTRRSKIVSRATGRYAAASFDQLLICPRSSFSIVGVAFFLSLKAISRFRPFSLVGPTQAFAFSEKSYEEGIYT